MNNAFVVEYVEQLIRKYGKGWYIGRKWNKNTCWEDIAIVWKQAKKDIMTDTIETKEQWDRVNERFGEYIREIQKLINQKINK